MNTPRDADNWAKAVERLSVGESEGDSANVEGRRVVGPLQGFGQLWQKTYRISLEGTEATPADVITAWKENYGSFWPPHHHFVAPLAGIRPGEIALISGGHGPVKLSTGVYVIYADQESFSFMNAEGHPWAGMITFSAHETDGHTVAQVQLLVRTNDPMMEVGFRFFGGSKAEDKMWQHTLRNVAAHFGVQAEPEINVVLVDRKRIWANLGNIRYNAALGTLLSTLRLRRRPHSSAGPNSTAGPNSSAEA